MASQLRVVLSQPIPEELQNGEGFGYVVAFRPSGTTTWIQTVVTSPDTPRYVFRNESILPFSPYEVKVGVYNNKGEGPFSTVATVFSAEEGTALGCPKPAPSSPGTWRGCLEQRRGRAKGIKGGFIKRPL